MTRAFLLTTALVATPLASQAEEIVFAWTPNPQTPQVDIALAEGMFDDAGLNISIVSFPTGREGFEALLGGQVELPIIMTGPASSRPYFEQLHEFIGTTLGTNVDFYLSGILDEAGVEAELVNASPVDLVSALARGDVEAIVPFPTFYSAAKDALGDDYRELRVPGYQVHYVLSASPEMLADRRGDLETFLGVLAKADAQVAAEPARAMEAVSASMQGAMPVSALEVMWQDVEIGLELSTDLLDLLVAEAAWIVGQGVVNAEPLSREAMAKHIAPAPLAAVAAEVVSMN